MQLILRVSMRTYDRIGGFIEEKRTNLVLDRLFLDKGRIISIPYFN